MSLPRFFLPPQCWDDADLQLEGDEARHCVKVRRLGRGDKLEVFDGLGRVARVEIAACEGGRVRLIVGELETLPPPDLRIWHLPALLKAEAFERSLEQAAELGVSVLQPVVADHSVLPWSQNLWERKRPKWERLLIEAAKQCHNPRLPELRRPLALAQALTVCPPDAQRLLLSLEPGAGALRIQPDPATVALLVGPEGDWSAAEHEVAMLSGFVPVTLGPLILRADTANAAALAVTWQEWRRVAKPS
jgi:16S rRNA (uracil1498-N3)-methyltransferase